MSGCDRGALRPGKEKEGRAGFAHCSQEDFFLLLIWRVSSVPSLGPWSPNAISQACKVNCIARLHATSRPHPPPGDEVVLESPGTSFAQHFKPGKYQELLSRFFPTPNRFLFFVLSNIIAPSYHL